MGVLVDTDVLVDLERGDAISSLEQVAPDDARSISVVTMSELLHGVRRASPAARARRAAFVEAVLGAIEPIAITPAVARVHADIWSELAAKGTMIGAHDLWIAATAITHDLGVLTRNHGDFSRVPGLRVLATPTANG